jgi:hypothetical protein
MARRGRGRMVIGVIKFDSDFRKLRIPPPIKLTTTI